MRSTGKAEARTVAAATVLVSLLAFGLYAALAAREVMFGDALELVSSAIRDGVAHPPGYPLWIALGHLASLVPVGPLAYRVNLTAAAYHAVTVGLVYASGYVLVRRHGPALFAALLLAIGSPLFVTWSLQAEAFSLNDLFAAAIVLLTLLWLDDARRWRLVLPIALLFGLGLANHQTLILLTPLPLWAAWRGRDAIRDGKIVPQTLCVAALLLLLGFWLPYLHTVLASRRLPAWEEGAVYSFWDLIDLIDRRVYGVVNLLPGESWESGSPVQRVALLVSLGGWPYLAIGAGLVGLTLRRRDSELVLGALIAIGSLVVFCALAHIRLELELFRGVFSRFGLLPIVALAPFSACAAYLLEPLASNRSLRYAVTGVALCVAFVPAALRLPALSLAGVHDARTLTNDIFAVLPPHAILLAIDEDVELSVPYFQAVEHRRPDVTVIQFGLLYYPYPYRKELEERGVVAPPKAGTLYWPIMRRDLLARANPSRPFFVAGDNFLVRTKLQVQPLVDGVASQMLPLGVRIDRARHYAEEVALESRSGYGDVTGDFWRSNGFGSEVRSFYANGFFSTALDAKQLGYSFDAKSWFERAADYDPKYPGLGDELR